MVTVSASVHSVCFFPHFFSPWRQDEVLLEQSLDNTGFKNKFNLKYALIVYIFWNCSNIKVNILLHEGGWVVLLLP